MTKTVTSLPSIRWVRSIWAALLALSPMNSRCNLSLLFASWRTVGDLADQGRRAAVSVALNLREGSAYLAGSASRRRFFDIAHGSAWETNAVLDIARCCGFDGLEDRTARALAGRVAAMTTALVGRR